MSKRKLPATGDTRSGKKGPTEDDDDGCASGSENAVELQDMLSGLGEESFPGGSEFGEEEDEGGNDDGDEGFDDGLGDALYATDLPESDAPDEDVELPLAADQIETAEELNLSDVSVSAAQARRIAPMIFANEALTVIHFAGHDLPVGELKDEEELEWDSEEFTDVEAIIIAEFLKSNTSVKRLDLARNQIADDGANALAHALSVNTTLEYLNLESNVVAEKGGVNLCRAVNVNTTLQYLNLQYNAIPSACQHAIRAQWTRVRQLGLHL